MVVWLPLECQILWFLPRMFLLNALLTEIFMPGVFVFKARKTSLKWPLLRLQHATSLGIEIILIKFSLSSSSSQYFDARSPIRAFIIILTGELLLWALRDPDLLLFSSQSIFVKIIWHFLYGPNAWVNLDKKLQGHGPRQWNWVRMGLDGRTCNCLQCNNVFPNAYIPR